MLQTWVVVTVSAGYLAVLFAVAFYAERRARTGRTLAAQGKSNRDIAQALVFSERTARTHVSNMLTKLGLASRTQAALWAIREGLVSAPS